MSVPSVSVTLRWQLPVVVAQTSQVAQLCPRCARSVMCSSPVLALNGSMVLLVTAEKAVVPAADFSTQTSAVVVVSEDDEAKIAQLRRELNPSGEAA